MNVVKVWLSLLIRMVRDLPTYTLSGRIGKVVSSHAESCNGCKIESRLWLSCSELYYERRAQGVLPMRVGGSTSQLDLPSLMPLFVAGCGRLQLGVPYWVASVIDRTFCGSSFSTGRLLAIEDFTFVYFGIAYYTLEIVNIFSFCKIEPSVSLLFLYFLLF